MSTKTPIMQEIDRLSLLIAVNKYDFKEAILAGTPLGILQPLMQDIATMQLQVKMLRDGRFKELPYNIKLLHRKK